MPVMLQHDSIFLGQGYQEPLALTFSASVAKYELPNKRCFSLAPAQEERNQFLSRTLIFEEELLISIHPALKYNLIHQEKHRNETSYLWYLLSLEMPCKLVRISFKMLRKSLKV